jgi:putative spermidine/putrescine transport system substrate-binding protein
MNVFTTRSLLKFSAALTVCGLLAACAGNGDSKTSGGDGAGGLVIASYGDLYTSATKEFFADPFAAANGGLDVEFVPSLAGGAVAAIHAQNDANKVQWDVLDGFSGIDTWQLFRDGMLVEFTPEQQDKLSENLADGMVTPFGFSYGNSTSVIACNPGEVEACPTNAAEFFDVEHFPGDRTMFAQDPLPALAMAALASGADRESLFPIDIDAAFDKLDSIRDDIRVFYTTADQSQQVMLSGEVGMGIMWEARAFELAKKGIPDVAVTFQDGLYEPWYIAAVKGGPNEDNAVAYLEWVAAHPDGATKWMEKVGFGIPMPEAFDSLPQEKALQFGDYPDNLEQSVRVDYEWYLDNRKEIDARWRDFVSN